MAESSIGAESFLPLSPPETSSCHSHSESRSNGSRTVGHRTSGIPQGMCLGPGRRCYSMTLAVSMSERTIWSFFLVLTQKSREGKLERVDFHRKGKDHAKDATNIYAGIQGGSGEAGSIESQALGPDCTRSGHCREY